MSMLNPNRYRCCRKTSLLSGVQQRLAGLMMIAWLAAWSYGGEMPCSKIIAFYYGWYGNPTTDGAYSNWNHPVADSSGKQFPGGDEIGANYYPKAGAYSCNDPETLRRQMKELREAGVGVICASWWGKDTYTDKSLPKVLDAAAQAGIGVAFHLEPFPGRSAETTRKALEYLGDRFGKHPATYRPKELGNRPLVFVYDSYLIKAEDWSTLFSPTGSRTLRGTPWDVCAVGLWVKESDGTSLVKGHFDGFYTYFAANGFTWGASTTNWAGMSKYAKQQGKTFMPSVGPGYIDTRIRPWNGSTTRSREKGAYYDRMFQAAVSCKAPFITLTSYNEWHEGSQIEPAVPKTTTSYQYLDYEGLEPDYYLKRTRHWVDLFLKDAAVR